MLLVTHNIPKFPNNGGDEVAWQISPFLQVATKESTISVGNDVRCGNKERRGKYDLVGGIGFQSGKKKTSKKVFFWCFILFNFNDDLIYRYYILVLSHKLKGTNRF